MKYMEEATFGLYGHILIWSTAPYSLSLSSGSIIPRTRGTAPPPPFTSLSLSAARPRSSPLPSGTAWGASSPSSRTISSSACK